MKTTYNIFIAEDHPIIAKAYKRVLEKISKTKQEIQFVIDMATDCESAIEFIKKYTKDHKIPDLVFLDIQLPPSLDGKIISGEDLGLKIRKLFPTTKIIIATMFGDNYRIHSIFKNLNPEGFLVKNDLDPEDLPEIITTVLKGIPYYSETVLGMLRKEISTDVLLDHIDRKLLYELSIGTKMKELPSILPLSIAGIEKRKRHLKKIFKVYGLDDRELLAKAREKGFI